MRKKQLVASSILVGMALSSVAPLVGENSNINIVSAATQKVLYAENKNDVLTMYEVYAKNKLNQHYDSVINSTVVEEPTQTLADEDVVEEEVVEPIYTDMSTPSNNSFKSYMDYKCITSVNSPQYTLQQSAYTDPTTGIRMVDGRYCIAVGSYYTTTIGTYIDLIMENGSIIPCILGDQKADAHTDSATHRQNPNGSITEFIVQTNAMSSAVRTSGSLSNALDELQGEISYIRVYE